MFSESFPTALRAVLKVTAFYHLAETLDTTSPPRPMLSLIVTETLTLERRGHSSMEEHENMYIIIQTSLKPTAAINTCGGPHPAGSVPGSGTMSFCPLQGQAGLHWSPWRIWMLATHTFLCDGVFARGLSVEEWAKAALLFVCLSGCLTVCLIGGRLLSPFYRTPRGR